jgi:hypothetical protein
LKRNENTPLLLRPQRNLEMGRVLIRPIGRGREARSQPAIKPVGPIVSETQRQTSIFNPFGRMQMAALSLKQAADREHVLKTRMESE